MFRLALNEDQLLPEERKEVETFYLKQEAIKNVLIEYESLKKMESANDLKKFTLRKKELLKKIWQLNQEHNISLMSKIQLDDTTITSNKIEIRSNNSMNKVRTQENIVKEDNNNNNEVNNEDFLQDDNITFVKIDKK